MKKILLTGWVVLVFALIFISQGIGEDQLLEKNFRIAGQKYVPGEIIVKFKQEAEEGAIRTLNSKHGAKVLHESEGGRFRRMSVPRNRRVPQVAKIYSKDQNVEYAEPNYIAQALWTPNDAYYKYQWHMDNTKYGGINMQNAWDIETGNSDVVVAVVDTGVAYENYVQRGRAGKKTYYYRAPDLANTKFVPGYDFVNNDFHPNDDEGHGTHITGTIAQSTNNKIGVSGIAFNCSIMPVKVLNKSGSGTYADIAEGIRYAADNGANVINLSLGGEYDSITLKDAIAYAYSKDVTIIAASGNDGSNDTINYPAAYDEYCIAVGATRYDEAVSYYSNGGESLDLAAPGGDLNVDQNGDKYADGILQQTFGNRTNDWGYWFYAGTSCSAAHASGVAALLISNGVAITPDDVKNALESTAEDKGPEGWDPEYGWGILDAYAALQWAGTMVNPQETSQEEIIDEESPVIANITGNISNAMPGSRVTISATITDNVGVSAATLYCTTAGSSLAVMSMYKNSSNDVWSAEIVIPSDKTGTITYYVIASDGTNETRSPAAGTYFIKVMAPAITKNIMEGEKLYSYPVPRTVNTTLNNIKEGEGLYKLSGTKKNNPVQLILKSIIQGEQIYNPKRERR